MDLMQRALKILLPRGLAWRLQGDWSKVMAGIGSALETVRKYVAGIVSESQPQNADDTLAEWYAMLGLPYDPTQTLADRQNQASQAFNSAGGQDKDYLDARIQIAFPDVHVETVEGYFVTANMVGVGMVGQMQTTDYPSWLASPPTDGTFPYAYFRVVGEVDFTADLTRLQGLLDRLAPAELEPVYDVRIRNITPTAEAGLGMVGIMQVGRTKDDT